MHLASVFNLRTQYLIKTCFFVVVDGSKGLFENTRIGARKICGGRLYLFDLDQ